VDLQVQLENKDHLVLRGKLVPQGRLAKLVQCLAELDPLVQLVFKDYEVQQITLMELQGQLGGQGQLD
jgi:hypothetical protein